DGLQLFDADGQVIPLDPIQVRCSQNFKRNIIVFLAPLSFKNHIMCQISALPHSIRDINQSDTRVPSNLVDGTAPWLAPLANSMTAEEHKSSVIRCGQEYAAMTSSLPP